MTIFFVYSIQVILAILLTWLITIILTVTNVLPSPPGRPWVLGNDNNSKVLDILDHTPWVRVPYPGNLIQIN